MSEFRAALASLTNTIRSQSVSKKSANACSRLLQLDGCLHYWAGIDHQPNTMVNVSVWRSLTDAKQMETQAPMWALNERRHHFGYAVRGGYCGVCPAYKVKDDPFLKEVLVKKFNLNGVPCPGCRPGKGKVQFVDGICETYACISKRGHDYERNK